MEMIPGILFLVTAAVCTAACLVPQGNKRRTGKRKARSREQEREAHYMRNFRNYDGGVQEEFEE